MHLTIIGLILAMLVPLGFLFAHRASSISRVRTPQQIERLVPLLVSITYAPSHREKSRLRSRDLLAALLVGGVFVVYLARLHHQAQDHMSARRGDTRGGGGGVPHAAATIAGATSSSTRRPRTPPSSTRRCRPRARWPFRSGAARSSCARRQLPVGGRAHPRRAWRRNEQVDGFRELRTRLLAMADGAGLQLLHDARRAR